jgi:glutaredoxin
MENANDSLIFYGNSMTTNVTEPAEKGITVYFFNGCIGCKTVLDFLTSNNIDYTSVDCTSYFPVDLMPLVNFIEKYISCFEDYADRYKNQIIFPMIFNNGKFIGYLDNYTDYFKNLN